MYNIYLLLEVLAMYNENFNLNKRTQSWTEQFFCISSFPLSYNIIWLYE